MASDGLRDKIEDITTFYEIYDTGHHDGGSRELVNDVVKAVAAWLRDKAKNYPADVFTPDGTSKDAIAGTALRTVLLALARSLDGEQTTEAADG